MRVFVLTFDSYFDSCGSSLELIGVFQSKDKVKRSRSSIAARNSFSCSLI